MCVMVAMLLSRFISACLILVAVKSVLDSEKCVAKHSWSCKPNKNMSLDRMLVVSLEFPHRSSCFCT